MKFIYKFFRYILYKFVNLQFFTLHHIQNIYIDKIENKNNLNELIKKNKLLKEKLLKYPLSNITKVFVITSNSGFNTIGKIFSDFELIEIHENDIIFSNHSNESLLSLFSNSFIVLTNNSLNKIGIDVLLRIKKVVKSSYFLVQDWDSHHGIALSQMAMSLCDVYVPTHLDSNLLVARNAIAFTDFIPSGTSQWSKKFLIENSDFILNSLRSDRPLGKHSYYPKFSYRNAVISMLSDCYQEIAFTNESSNLKYHDRSEIDRLNEWVSYKIHFIVPVLNDLPIRFFDALATGGIPLVPHFLRQYLDLINVPRDHYVIYKPFDLLNPANLINSSLSKFDFESLEGISTRSNFCINKFHADNIIQDIVYKSIDVLLSISRSK